MLGRMLLAALLTLGALAPAQADEPLMVDAKAFIDPALPDCGIQKAIDSLPKTGGVVVLPEGTFVLERYLYLKSGTMLRGQGEKTILHVGRPEQRRNVTARVRGIAEVPVEGDLTGLKPGMIVFAWRYLNPGFAGYIREYRVKEVQGQVVVLHEPSTYELLPANKAQLSWGLTTALAAPAVRSARTIEVEHPDLFKPGDAIAFSGKGDLWDHHFNVITAIDGNTLTLERTLTVASDAGALVHHAYCLITADGEKNIGVEDLVIQGWESEEKPRWGGFNLGGFHTVRCDNITLKNVTVQDWNGDAISIQSGKEARVENCAVLRNRGRGFHPGTNFTNAEFVNCKAIGNDGDGFYYCWHNNNVNLRNSLIKDNRNNGVGGLGNPGDRKCIVEGNTIEGNARAGVEINGGMSSGSIIRNNIIRDNSRSKPGSWPGIAIYATAEDAQDYLIEGNTVESTLETPTQWIGIEERNGDPVKREIERKGKKVEVTKLADRNRIVKNTVKGHKTADILAVGPNTVVEGNGDAVVKR